MVTNATGNDSTYEAVTGGAGEPASFISSNVTQLTPKSPAEEYFE